jgi:hypothetical protein
VRVLLDENFPLGLVRALKDDGLEVDHIISIGWRGASDAQIRERLADAKLVFLTQDADFLSGDAVAATIVVSRVRQARSLMERIQLWRSAVTVLLASPQKVRRFELTDDGVIVPWLDKAPRE